jgi:hypothetical protein
MKINFGFGFNGGQLTAECNTFEEADQVIDYALKRGIITMTVTDANGESVKADITSAESVKADVNTDVKPAKSKVVRAYTKDEIQSGALDKTETAAAPECTPADAAQAVKDYAAKNGVEAGRALLATLNLKRTSEITNENAAAVLAAVKEAS